MPSRPDNIAIRPGGAPHGLVAAVAAAAPAGALFLLACSAAPARMECRELQMRIDYGDLTPDQMRFAMDELATCQGRVKEAERKDSILIEGAERRFTPADE
jgi:hypothetical protein